MEEQYVLIMEGISKTFPGVKALQNVHLKVRKGTVHALMGENGAGKSTFMKILGGMHKPDAGSGSITLNGKSLELTSPTESLNAGISMIHQELTSVFEMTVAENIYLGREPLKAKIVVDEEKLNKQTKELLDGLGIDLNPKTKMKNLTIAKMQLVEIAKAISHNSDVIIMDEPTSAIPEKEVELLHDMIRKLTKKGVSVVYISHKMDEIFRISDDITVLRDGQYVGTKQASDLSKKELISMMVGRELDQLFPKAKVEIGEIKLEVKNLTVDGVFEDVNFYVRKGEILGFAGLMGAGRSEVMETLFGIRKKNSGEINIEGKKVEIKTPENAISCGLAFITEDRKLTGLFLPHSILENMVAANLNRYKKGIRMDHSQMKTDCERQSQLLRVKTPSIMQKVKNLSGGNQQKVLVGKWLLTDADIIILDEPTRGIDVGAKSEIHALMGELVKQGKSVIMISSELPEVLGMSDRIMVMHEGRITGELSRDEATQDRIMQYATGTHESA